MNFDEPLCLLGEIVELLEVHDAHVVRLGPHNTIDLQATIAQMSGRGSAKTHEARVEGITHPIRVQTTERFISEEGREGRREEGPGHTLILLLRGGGGGEILGKHRGRRGGGLIEVRGRVTPKGGVSSTRLDHLLLGFPTTVGQGAWLPEPYGGVANVVHHVVRVVDPDCGEASKMRNRRAYRGDYNP